MKTCFFIKKASIYIPISPKHADNIIQGVNEYLNGQIMKFVPELQGILIAYSNIIPQSEYAKIFSDNPLLYLTIVAEFTLFCPEIGQTLIGHVNKTSSDHIGCLVHGLFNASISSEDIPSLCEYLDAEQSWGDIVNGSYIKFKIKQLLVSNKMLTLVGSLQGQNLGYIALDLPALS